MVTISLCMIVKNEEDTLATCLESVKSLVDEIIIADTGSTDGTRELARSYTDKVYAFPWVDDFAAARNFAFSKATMDYCMWLDADDVLTPENLAAFQALKESLSPETDVVMCRYHTGFDESGKVAFSYYRERIIRRDSGMVWQGAVHEAISPSGNILYSEAAVTHHKTRPSDPDRNLHIYETQLEAGIALDPRSQFYYARELYYHARYLDACEILEAFLADGMGWIENNIEACRLLSLCREHLGEPLPSLCALLRSFVYDAPRAEVCCDLGRKFLEQNKLPIAAYWYEAALRCERNDRSGAFVSEDCYGFLPCIQLAVCYDRMGELEKARVYNERAGQYKPKSPAYLFNKTYFSSL